MWSDRWAGHPHREVRDRRRHRRRYRHGPLLPIATSIKQGGNRLISIVGARTKDLLILEDDMRAISDEIVVTTDDGSYAKKGFVTTALQELIDRGEKIDLCIAIGPVPMMRAVAEVTRPTRSRRW